MKLTKEKWLKTDIEPFLEYLKSFSKGEEKSVWEKRIVNTKLPCLAVPSTKINAVVNSIYKGNYISFLNLNIWENHSTTLIFGKLLSKIKDFKILKPYLINYSQKADNWSTIDCLKFKFNNNVNDFIQLSKQLIQSPYIFSRRLALIILLKLLSFENCTDIIFDMLNNLSNETEYYVNMAGAWLLAECMTKYRELTLNYYSTSKTNDFIINKSISKCRDSFRISKEDKQFLLNFKR